MIKVRKANSKDSKEAVKISESLKEWFDENGRRNIKVDIKHNNLIVAYEKNKVLGFLVYTTNCGKIMLLWMGVSLDAQRKGAGEKMINWLVKEAKKYKLGSIEVETLPDEYDYKPYIRTRNFYYKNGFKRIAYLKARFKGWDDQILLEKTI